MKAKLFGRKFLEAFLTYWHGQIDANSKFIPLYFIVGVNFLCILNVFISYVISLFLGDFLFFAI